MPLLFFLHRYNFGRKPTRLMGTIEKTNQRVKKKIEKIIYAHANALLAIAPLVLNKICF